MKTLLSLVVLCLCLIGCGGQFNLAPIVTPDCARHARYIADQYNAKTQIPTMIAVGVRGITYKSTLTTDDIDAKLAEYYSYKDGGKLHAIPVALWKGEWLQIYPCVGAEGAPGRKLGLAGIEGNFIEWGKISVCDFSDKYLEY